MRRKLLKSIHMRANQIGMREEEYRDFLYSLTGKISCKDLTTSQLFIVLDELKYIMKSKYDEIGYREGMATPRQIRMIEAMWDEVTRYKTRRDKDLALCAFLERIIGKKKLLWLERNDVQKVIKALKIMKRQKRQRRKSCQEKK